MDLQEKYDHARAADQTLQHPIMQEVFKQYGEATKEEGGGDAEVQALLHVLMSVAHHAAQVARAQALGMDPEGLRNTPEEHAKLAAMLPPKFKEEEDRAVSMKKSGETTFVDDLKARAAEAAAFAADREAGS